jgi:hypothetical protein
MDVIGIALDVSGSMTSILSNVVEETIGILDKFEPESVIFCEFSTRFHCETMRRDDAKQKLNEVKAGGSTAMYDGVTTMVRELHPIAMEGKNILAIVVTDGFENSSIIYDRNDLIEAKAKLREIAGEDSIREICISETVTQASKLLHSTPGLRPASSRTATRDCYSIREAFKTMS